MDYLPFRSVKIDILCGYDKRQYEGVYDGGPVTVSFNTYTDTVTYDFTHWDEDDILSNFMYFTMSIDDFLKATHQDIINRVEYTLYE